MQQSVRILPASCADCRKQGMMEPIRSIVTKESLINGLRGIGVSGNMILEVHSSLSSFGFVAGGARTVVDALMEIAQDGGTILMPMQISDNSEPSAWTNPPLIPELWDEVRENTPPSDPRFSDIPHMGAIAEEFRNRPGVIFSDHPSSAYAAWGRYAKLLCNRHSLHFSLAEESPAAKLYEMKGFVLMLGTDFDTCTCMHLAEYRSDCRPIGIHGASALGPDGPVWKQYLDLNIDSDDFDKIRPVMEKKRLINETDIGKCHVRFFSANTAVDEAVKYFEKTIVYDLYR